MRRCAFIFLLLLIPGVACRAAGDYTITAIADTSGAAFGGQSFSFLGYASVNDIGRIAFVGDDFATGYSNVYVTSADTPSPLSIRSLTTGFDGPSRQFYGAALSDPPNEYVASTDRFSGAPATFFVREWPVDGGLMNLVGSSQVTSKSFGSATSYMDINSSLDVAFLGLTYGNLDYALFEGTDVGLTLPLDTFPFGTVLRPQISNDGTIVISANGTLETYQFGQAGIAEDIADQPAFSQIGNDPGISADGNVVAFYAEKPDGTVGIYVYDRAANDCPVPNGGNRAICPVEELTGAGNQDGFTDLSGSINNRVGVVVSTEASDNAVADKTQLVTVIFTAKRNGYSGVYTVDLLFWRGRLVAKATPRVVMEQPESNAPNYVLVKPIAFNPETRDTYIAFSTVGGGVTTLYRAKRRCQISDVPDDKQINAKWAAEPNGYHTVAEGDTQHQDIFHNGCALTSATNVLTYFGVRSSISAGDLSYLVQDMDASGEIPLDSQADGGTPTIVALNDKTTLDPLIDNSLFRQHQNADGINGVFSGTSDIVFDELPGFAQRRQVSLVLPPVGNEDSDSGAAVGSGGNSTLDQIADFFVCNGVPIILKVQNQGENKYHYVVATGRIDPLESGRIKTTYSINDPANLVSHSDRDLFDTESSSNRYYQGTYYGIRTLAPPLGAQQQDSISFTAESPVDVVVTDPLGRRKGFDPNSGMSYDEISNASYFSDAITSLDGTTNGDTIRTVLIGTSRNVYGQIVNNGDGVVAGTYAVDVVGTGSGNYRIGISVTDQNGNEHGAAVVGNTSVGQSDRFDVNFGANLTSVPAIDAVDGTPLVTVPALVGQTQTSAATVVSNLGLRLGTVSAVSDSNAPPGTVVQQYPFEGDSALPGVTVDLVVSSGPNTAIVPNVVGETQGDASAAIIGAGLVVGTVTTQSSSIVPLGQVISQSPTSGASVVFGAGVDLTISSGALAGDVDGDGAITCNDLSLIKASFGARTGDATYNAPADVNKDGVINIFDLAFVSQRLPQGTVCN